jgi:hypothetical protein
MVVAPGASTSAEGMGGVVRVVVYTPRAAPPPRPPPRSAGEGARGQRSWLETIGSRNRSHRLEKADDPPGGDRAGPVLPSLCRFTGDKPHRPATPVRHGGRLARAGRRELKANASVLMRSISSHSCEHGRCSCGRCRSAAPSGNSRNRYNSSYHCRSRR